MLDSSERVNPHPPKGWRFGQSATNSSRTAISEESFGNLIAVIDALIIASQRFAAARL